MALVVMDRVVVIVDVVEGDVVMVVVIVGVVAVMVVAVPFRVRTVMTPV